MSEQIHVMTPQQFEHYLKLILDEMLKAQQKADYVEADRLRQKGLIQKKQWEQNYTQYMNHKHLEEQYQLEHEYQQNLEQCNKDWNNKIQAYVKECEEHIEKSDNNNQRQIDQTRKTMTQQWPAKVKESHELLNLRQMEHHMSKQKDFHQAHLIQTRINKLYQTELKGWNDKRDSKIDQTVTNLRNKHTKERQLLNKRIQIQMQDNNNKWRNDKLALLQRYQNNLKQMKARQQRQILSFYGEFKTKGGTFSFKIERQE